MSDGEAFRCQDYFHGLYSSECIWPNHELTNPELSGLSKGSILNRVYVYYTKTSPPI